MANNFFKDTMDLYIPDHLHQLPNILMDMNCIKYRINRHKKVQSSKNGGIKIVYAPAPLSFYFLSKKQSRDNIKIISHKNALHYFVSLYWLRLRLKNERRLMGSDVPSPLMTKALRQYVEIADYFYFTIGDWLVLTKDFNKKIKAHKNTLFWLKDDTKQNHLNKFLQN